MPSDLETQIREALLERARGVTPERLRHHETLAPTRASAHHAKWPRLTPLLAAACVLIVVLAIVIVRANHEDTSKVTDGPPISLNSLAGTSWTLIEVHHSGHDTTTIPASLQAGLTFGRHGNLYADDGVNGYNATYRVATPSQLAITAGTATLVLYAGHDPSTLAAIRAIDAVVYQANGRAHTVTAHDHTNRLELSAGRYVLTLGSP